MASQKKLFRYQVIALLSQQCKAVGSQAAWAKMHGLHPPHVSDMLAGRRELSEKLLRALGLRRRVYYERDDGQ